MLTPAGTVARAADLPGPSGAIGPNGPQGQPGTHAPQGPHAAGTHPPAGHGGQNTPHAVVIGSGFGGLAAAVRLLARGWRVTVVEQLDAPGGRASVFRQDGFVFDAGPTVVTAPFLLEELWQLAGRRLSDDVTLVPVDPFYRLHYDDGTDFDYVGDPARMRANIARLAPGDEDGYDRYMAQSHEMYRVGFEQLGHVPFSDWKSMVRAVPAIMRVQGWRSVYGMVARHVKNEQLRMAMTFHTLLVGGSPFSTSSVYSLISTLERSHGVHWTMGGTNRLVSGLVKLIEGMGGTVRCASPVARILVEKGRARGVQLASGEVLKAQAVVSNADAANTYRKLVAPEHRRRMSDRHLEGMKYSMSLLVWYFGVKGHYPDVAHHTILLGPRYEGLLADIFQRQVLSDDFSIYLHRPTATDSSVAPAGHDNFYALVPVPHLGAGIDWETQAEPLRAALQRRLEATLLPGLGGRIVTQKMIRPTHFEQKLGSYLGAAFGPAPLLTQSAWFRPHNESEDVRGLYLVGAGTHPGAGLPGVLSTARVLDHVVPHASQVSMSGEVLS